MKNSVLELLSNNARMKVRDLADILNESKENVISAIDELENDKIICGYHAVVNWSKTSNDKVTAIIQVSSKPTTDSGYDEVAKKIASYSEVTDLYLMSGHYEFTVIINGKTMKEVATFVAHKLAPIEGVTGTLTSFVLTRYKLNGSNVELENNNDQRLIVTP